MILGQWGLLGVFGGGSLPPFTEFTVCADTNINYRVTGRDLYRATGKVGGVNVFTLTLTDWLCGEEIDEATVVVDDMTKNGVVIDNTQDAIGVSLTGITHGRYPVHFSWITATGRGDCMTGFIDVLEC
jgi:hypothetical protein